MWVCVYGCVCVCMCVCMYMHIERFLSHTQTITLTLTCTRAHTHTHYLNRRVSRDVSSRRYGGIGHKSNHSKTGRHNKRIWRLVSGVRVWLDEWVGVYMFLWVCVCTRVRAGVSVGCVYTYMCVLFQVCVGEWMGGGLGA